MLAHIKLQPQIEPDTETTKVVEDAVNLIEGVDYSSLIVSTCQ